MYGSHVDDQRPAESNTQKACSNNIVVHRHFRYIFSVDSEEEQKENIKKTNRVCVVVCVSFDLTKTAT